MKKTNAIIGGEGNGGIIYPSSHYGRDSMVGVALFLTHLANQDKTVAEIRASYPQYYMSKNKIELTPQIDVDAVLATLTEKYKSENITTIDGVKIDFPTRMGTFAKIKYRTNYSYLYRSTNTIRSRYFSRTIC
jgi:phosphomannomutase